MCRALVLTFCLWLAAAAVLPAQALAGGPPAIDPTAIGPPSIDPTDEPVDGSSQSPGSGVTPLIAPIPFKDTQIGWGLGLFGGLIHRFDADTTAKPSTGMVGGFYSENGSWGLVAGEIARLGGDAWRLRGLYTHDVIRYDFYGIGEAAGDAGLSVALEQDVDLAFVSASRRLLRGLYLGVTVLWVGTEVRLRDSIQFSQPVPPLPPLPPDFTIPDLEGRAETDLFAPGVHLEYDTRNDDYWPVRGSVARAKGSFFNEELGGSKTFQRYQFGWSWYTPLVPERLTLATNINAGGASEDAPFYTLPTVGGGRDGLRGYTSGRYRDRVMTTVQGELRYHLPNRFGGVVFGGFGQVAPDVSGLFDAQVLWGGGFGGRYQLTKDYLMHLRCDLAWGRNEFLFYFSVAEAF